ncbi:MAG: cobalamin-binding protein [Acidobacteriia bacterium]|nr:cobalamin-binding protein [Terriglobia bacterium]
MSVRNAKRMARAGSPALLALLFLAAAPALAQNSGLPPAAPAFHEVTDEAGRHVRVPQVVQRIVSLAPSLTETVYALGAQDRLVGDTDFCDYPAAAQNKPKVGGAINPSIEQIVALRPDLVLVTKGLNRFDTVLALERMNIPAYATDPHTVTDVLASTARLAEVLGIPEAGRALTEDLQHRLADLQARLAGRAPRRVLFVVWAEPLISIGQNTFIADALRHAGAVSVVEAAQDWPQVNLEEAVRWRPEFLVFAASHSESVARNFQALAERPGWRDLEAVRQRHIAVISDAVNRPAPRLISAIEDLARQIHPEAFSEKGRTENAAPAEKPSPRRAALPPPAARQAAAISLRGGCTCGR